MSNNANNFNANNTHTTKKKPPTKDPKLRPKRKQDAINHYLEKSNKTVQLNNILSHPPRAILSFRRPTGPQILCPAPKRYQKGKFFFKPKANTIPKTPAHNLPNFRKRKTLTMELTHDKIKRMPDLLKFFPENTDPKQILRDLMLTTTYQNNPLSYENLKKIAIDEKENRTLRASKSKQFEVEENIHNDILSRPINNAKIYTFHHQDENPSKATNFVKVSKKKQNILD